MIAVKSSERGFQKYIGKENVCLILIKAGLVKGVTENSQVLHAFSSGVLREEFPVVLLKPTHWFCGKVLLPSAKGSTVTKHVKQADI